ncbi:MAG: hypothetical protein ABMA15_24515 [Vicinamibacterales bacterium]
MKYRVGWLIVGGPILVSEAIPLADPSNDLGFCCTSNMVRPRSEVQAELCGARKLTEVSAANLG